MTAIIRHLKRVPIYIKALVLLSGLFAGVSAVTAFADAGTYIVSGTVQLGSQPAGGMNVVISGTTNRVASDGHYSTGGLANSSYALKLFGNIPCDQPHSVCNENINVSWSVQNNGDDPIDVNGADVTQNLALPATVPVTVTIRNADGTPTGGATAEAYSTSGQATDVNDSALTYTIPNGSAVDIRGNASTGSGGTYTLYVIPGFTYQICGIPQGSGSAQACADPMAINSATSAIVNLPAPIVNHTLSGTIMLGSQAVSNALVFPYGGAITKTANNGHYSIPNLSDGSYPLNLTGGNVVCDHPIILCNESISLFVIAINNSTNPPSSLITVNGADVTQNLALPATVPVTITTNTNGIPTPGASVDAVSQSGVAIDANDSSIAYTNQQNNFAASIYGNGSTDGTGTYTLYVIPGYTYQICGTTSGSNPASACNAVPVNSATSTTIDLPPQVSTHSVSGTVHLGSQPASGTGIAVGGTVDQIDSNGNYSFSNVSDGSYPLKLVSAIPCDQPSDVCNEVIDTSLDVKDHGANPVNVSGSDVTQNLALPATVPVAINVENADGTVAPGVTVDAYAVSGQAVDANSPSLTYTLPFEGAMDISGSDSTDSNGAYTLYVIPGFTYQICAAKASSNTLRACAAATVTSSTSALVTLPLPTPVSLIATTPANPPILHWTGANLVDSAEYVVHRNGVAIGTSTAPSYTDTSAPTGTNSYYVVIDVNGSDGLPSNTVDVVVPPVPDAPANLTASSPTQHPSLTWNTVSGATSYNIYRNDVKIDSSTTASYTDSTATPGTNTYYVTTVNAAGESGHSNSVDVLVDRTVPTITYTVAPVPNGAGWNNGDVTVTFTCSDSLSGIQSCSQPVTVNAEGAIQSVTGTAVDNASNTANVTATFSIDKTTPTLGTPSWSANPATTDQDATLTVPVSDNLSGVAGGEYYLGDTDPGIGNGTAMTLTGGNLSSTFSGLAAGTYTVNVRSQDVAGNWSPVTTTTLVVVPATVAPTIASASSYSTGMRDPITSADFTFTTTGTPKPVLTESGTLPAGLTFTDNGNGTANLSGMANTGTNGTYPLTITATNSAGSVSQSFTLTITTAPSVPTSTTSSTGSTDLTTSFGGAITPITITATGYPTPSLTETTPLPSGLNFHDNHDGTATISGTPSGNAAGSYTITVKATNSSGTYSQTYTIYVDKSAVFTPIPNGQLTATVGQAYSVTVTTVGFPAPSILASGSLPAGLTFTDNGDGTATISGTPQTGAGGAYPLILTATNVAGPVTYSFTLKVNEAPVITSANSDTILLGAAMTPFTVTTTGYPTAHLSASALPSGVKFHDNGDGTATISGTPSGNASGTHTVTITATNSAGTTTQTFTLVVQ